MAVASLLAVLLFFLFFVSLFAGDRVKDWLGAVMLSILILLVLALFRVISPYLR